MAPRRLNKKSSRHPISVPKFLLFFSLIPAAVAGLLFWYAYTNAINSDPYGIAEAFAVIAVYRLLSGVAYFIIGAATVVSLIYTIRFARWNGLYYVISLAVPLLILGYVIVNQTIRAVDDSRPERVRYEQNVERCSKLSEAYRMSFLGGSDMNTKTYAESIVTEYQQDIQRTNETYRDLNTDMDTVFDAGGPCDDDEMTEQELAALDDLEKRYDAAFDEREEVADKLIAASRFAKLNEIHDIEKTGDIDAAYTYARKNIGVSYWWTPGKSCVTATGVCALEWVNMFGVEKTTQQLIDEYWQ